MIQKEEIEDVGTFFIDIYFRLFTIVPSSSSYEIYVKNASHKNVETHQTLVGLKIFVWSSKVSTFL